ncbi:MAG: DUF1467 family protein [Pseudolabrys sp.]
MSIATAIAIYFLVWWIVLFAVLPWGVHSQEEEGADVIPGTDPGAPVRHRIWSKLLWTTLVSAVVFAILAVIYIRGWIPYEFLSRISAPPSR